MNRKPQNGFKHLALAGVLASIFALSGCGGGGTDPEKTTGTTKATGSISGTAAGGAAVVGTVYIKDSLGATKNGLIAADGKYSIDVTGMTGPFMLKAEGNVGNTHVSYFSAATNADAGQTINITPLTNLLVSNIAGQLAENYYSDHANFNGITADKLAAAQTALQAKLKPILGAMGLDNSVNLLRSSFAADHSGLDAVLDMLKIENDANTVNIINRMTGLTVASDDVTKSADDSTEVDLSQEDADALTTVKDGPAAAAKLLTDMAKLFATSIPSKQSFSTLFDSNLFLDGGLSLDQFYSDFNRAESIGMTFGNVVVTPVEGTPNRIALDFIWDSPTNTERLKSYRVFADNTTGSWKLIGNQLMVDIEIKALAILNENGDMNTQSKTSGLNLQIELDNYNATHDGIIHHALITGPGLPPEGVAFNENALIEDCAISSPSHCVNIADTHDNGKYNIKLYHSSNLVLNGSGYEVTLGKKPLAVSELTDQMFPKISREVKINDTLLNDWSMFVPNASLALSWTIPSTLKATWLNVHLGSGNNLWSESFQLQGNDMGKTTVLPSDLPTVSRFDFWLNSEDVYGRQFAHDVYAP